MGEEDPRGQTRPELADLSSESGWVTTEVAARAVRVSPRTIRRYIEQGKLEERLAEERRRREAAEAERDELRQSIEGRPYLRGIVLVSVIAAVAGVALVILFLSLPL